MHRCRLSLILWLRVQHEHGSVASHGNSRGNVNQQEKPHLSVKLSMRLRQVPKCGVQCNAHCRKMLRAGCNAQMCSTCTSACASACNTAVAFCQAADDVTQVSVAAITAVQCVQHCLLRSCHEALLPLQVPSLRTAGLLSLVACNALVELVARLRGVAVTAPVQHLHARSDCRLQCSTVPDITPR